TCTDALDMAVRSALSPPAPLGSLALNAMTQGRPVSAASKGGGESDMTGTPSGPGGLDPADGGMHWITGAVPAVSPSVGRYNESILSARDPDDDERKQDLDVPDLRLDLRRGRRRSRARHRCRHPLVTGAHELDLSRMRGTQGRLRNGADLNPGSATVRVQCHGIGPD